MKSKPLLSRRSFVSTATLSAAAFGLQWPAPIEAGEGYNAGRTGASLEGIMAAPEPARLNRNESPYGLPPAAVEAIREAITGKSNRYPGDEAITKLTEEIAKKFGVNAEQVVLGCGSTEILKMATEAFCSPSRAAVVAEPTFEAVVSNCPLAHARAVKIPVTKGHRHNLAKMWQAAGQGGGLIFFCNPSNPTGTLIGKREVERFIPRLPRGVVLLADEAYWDYIDTPDFESCVRYVKEGRPVVVSRTFSKVYGMAGLRLGYAIGRKDLIKRMARYQLANNPNQLAAAAASAALKDDKFVATVRSLNAEVRDQVATELRSMGLQVVPSQTNFILMKLGRPAQPVVEELKKRGVLVGRVFPAIPNYLRVSLGKKEEMRSFLRELGQVISAPAG
jgi:histidinol-phosphate aminotransferase